MNSFELTLTQQEISRRLRDYGERKNVGPDQIQFAVGVAKSEFNRDQHNPIQAWSIGRMIIDADGRDRIGSEI